VRAFECRRCGERASFEDATCARCGAGLGVVAQRLDLVTLDPPEHDGAMVALDIEGDARLYRCDHGRNACNWLVAEAGQQCFCCRLTRTTAADDASPSPARVATESAKRRLVYQLLDLGLLDVADDHGSPPIFDVLARQPELLVRGEVAASRTDGTDDPDAAGRSNVVDQLGEPYRTTLGYLRHEVGHLFWSSLVVDHPDRLRRFRRRFGDERTSAHAVAEAHAGGGPTPDWSRRHVSAYATVHPSEDWAETFAHYLHVRDLLQTAVEHGVSIDRRGIDPDQPTGSFSRLIAEWSSLAATLNAVNRSTGGDDVYPPVFAPVVADKLSFVHDAVQSP
jgi:hypothetical protein